MILNEASALPVLLPGLRRPKLRPACHSHAAIVHEIPESHHYNSLCESVTVPLLKPDFLLAELYLVLVGAEN